jgi:hypothetical protein
MTTPSGTDAANSSERTRTAMSFTVPPGPLAPVYRLDDFRTELPQDPAVDGSQVWGEVMAAAQLFGTLREAGMSVRFDVEDPTRPPRVRITDLEGRTLREIPPSLACDPTALEAEVLGPAA